MDAVLNCIIVIAVYRLKIGFSFFGALQVAHYHSSECQRASPRTMVLHFVSADGKEDGFKRLVYKLLGSNNHTVVIHYMGDESIAKSTTPHVRTLPSIMRQLECSEATPSVAYKRMVATSGPSQDHVAVQLPKNQKQVKNLQAK